MRELEERTLVVELRGPSYRWRRGVRRERLPVREATLHVPADIPGERLGVGGKQLLIRNRKAALAD